ncbi:LamG domain-containing protein [bacterium]|nr:LamG domain-containing protein [bacterium]
MARDVFTFSTFKRSAVLATAPLCLAGCFQTPFSTKAAISAIEGGSAAVLVTTDETGRATGSFDPSAAYDQLLAATSGEIAGTAAVFPPGALSVATDIAIESGASLAQGSALADLGLTFSNAISAAGASVIVRPADNVQLKQPMALSLPLPDGYGLVDLFLGDDNRLAILAKVFDTDGQLKSQLIPRSSLTVSDGKATFQTMAFGAFQTIVLENPVTEAKTATSTEPIVNKSGVAVITTTGVVSQSAIAATESLSPLTFKRFTPTFAVATRVVRMTVEFSENAPQITGCRGQIRDATKPATALFSGEVRGNPFENGTTDVAGPAIPGSVSGTMEMQLTCQVKDGRVARSDWASLGNVPKPDLAFVSFVPTFYPSTRQIKVTGELSESYASISSCTVKFRNPSEPTVIVHQFSKTAGTSQNATPDTMPYNKSGPLEASSTCTATDGRTATSSWVSIGTVPAGINGILTADQITATGARLTWTIPQGTASTTLYRVERAATTVDFDQNSTSAITAIQDWAEPATTGSTSQQLSVSGLVSGSSYAFRVGAKDDAGNILYYPVVVVRAGSSGTTPGGGVAPGSGGSGSGGTDIVPPTIGQYAIASQLVPGKITLQKGWAYDNVTAQNNLQYKVVYSDAPFTNASVFNTSSLLVTVRDWALSPGNSIDITQVNAAQADFKYYTVGVRDQAGNVSLHPSLHLKVPGPNLTSVNFWSYPAFVRDRLPFLEVSIQNSSQAAATLQYSITVGTKPGLTDILAESSQDAIDGTMSLASSGTGRITRDTALQGSSTLALRTNYYANLTISTNSGTVIAKLQAPIFVTRPTVLYEFENNANNGGESAMNNPQSVPYPGTTPTGFAFSSANRVMGNYAASFNGSQVITVPALTLAALAGSAGNGGTTLTGFTVGGWVYQTSTPAANGALFGFDDFIEVGHGANGKLSAFVKGMTSTLQSDVTLPVNQWNHVAVSGWAGGSTYSGQVAIFLNGLQIASQPVPASTTRFDTGAAASNYFKIGGNVWSSTDVKFTGQMDDVFVAPWSFSERMVSQLASSLNCDYDEVMTGLDIRAGGIIDRLGVRCSKYWDLNPDHSFHGPAVGGSGGSAVTFNCNDGESVSALDVVIGNTSFSPTVLSTVRATCANASTGAAGTSSDTYGSQDGGVSASYSCPAGKLARGVRIGPDSSGTFAGTLRGLNCK